MSKTHPKHWREHAKERFKERVNVGISYNNFEWKWFRKDKYKVVKSSSDAEICVAIINDIKVWFVVKPSKKEKFIATFLTEEMAMLAIGNKNDRQI